MARKRRKSGSGGKRRRARRRATAILINPRGRRHRRRNPGGISIKTAAKDMGRALLPAAAAGLAVGFIDSKFLGELSLPLRIGVKIIGAAAAGAFLRKKPNAAFAAMGAMLGTLSYDVGVRAAGGVIAASKGAGMKELAALAREDQQSMGLLQREMNGMGLLLTGMGDLPDQTDIMPNLGDVPDQTSFVPNLGDDDGADFVDQAMAEDFG